ncbi:hypothetical protein [Thermopirellula anaerolimosa]
MMTFLATVPVFVAVFCCLILAQTLPARRNRCNCRLAAEILESRRRIQRGNVPNVGGAVPKLPIRQAAGHCGACSGEDAGKTYSAALLRATR